MKMKITTVFLIIGSVLQMASANAAEEFVEELVCDNVLSSAEKDEMAKYVITKDMSRAEVKDCTKIGYNLSDSAVKAISSLPDPSRKKWACTACFYDPSYWSCAKKGN